MDSRECTECRSTIQVGGNDYVVVTYSSNGENIGIFSSVYFNGEEISSRKLYYGGTLTPQEYIHDVVKKQHNMTIDLFKAEKLGEEESPAYYLHKARELIRRGRHEEALDLLNDALFHYPDDAFLLSYFGYLTAEVQKDSIRGIHICHRAMDELKRKIPYGVEFFYPMFYLNLGRAYLAAGRKKEAVETFSKGIEIGGRNEEVMNELRRLGIRRPPLIPFLCRSNPLNKYIGILFFKLQPKIQRLLSY